MKSDFDMIVRKFEKDEDIKIYPVSDLHVGASEFLEIQWAAFREKLRDEPNSYITIGGDMMNNATRSSVSNVFEDRMRPSDQKRWLAEQLAPIKDRILCVVSGNHERRSEKDADDLPLYDICAKLDLEDIYRPNIAFIKIQIGDRGHATYTLTVTHGSGGGIFTGAAINRNERFGHVIEGMDILIVGHTHKGSITKPQKIVIDKQSNTVNFKQFVVVSSTSWLQFGGYALRGMLLPSSQDIQSLTLSGKEKEIRTTW